MITREEIFKKYHIDESHSKWDFMIDNWMSVEIFRVMHNGELPNAENSNNANYIYEFLDKFKDDINFASGLMKREDWGSLYLTAKREIYRLNTPPHDH